MNRRLITAIAATVIAIAPAWGDSLFSQKTASQGTLVSLKKARFAEGDIITVLIKEEIAAQTDANTNTKKESDVESEANAGDNTFLTAAKPDGFGITTAGKLPNWQIGMKNEQRTTGKTARKNTLETTVTCTVTKVNDNGTIELRGEKLLTMNREQSRMVVSGTARARDVTPANTLDSTQLANAVIELSGKGPLWNNQRRGVLTRLLDWVSPY
ncbi:MAG: flagellar basal body L-ring protein FlgH [Candidatus Hydrogenedentes bacterium]|nr:flagellar basal body L-ring protein FlgH [Candidatus Hydrogenedentota bacterium]